MKAIDEFLGWLPLGMRIGLVLFAIVSGIVTWTSWLTTNVPKLSYIEELLAKEIKYVDVKNDATMKYIDEKVNNLRSEAFSHSDLNKSEMMSEYKGLSAKLDMLILMIQQHPSLSRKGK